jgi:hypothetical protein
LLHNETADTNAEKNLEALRRGSRRWMLRRPGASKQQQQRRPQQKKTITLPALAAQGFEIKATIGSYLVLQNGKDVWFCYMLDTRSNCEPAE